jgi:hypothetical protein
VNGQIYIDYPKIAQEGIYLRFTNKYLFHYEKIFNDETHLKLTYKDDGVTIEDLDPNCLIPVKVIDMQRPEDITQEIIDEILQLD